jgi:ribonucleotide reductase beta subunit family protein with ferritin-like domain
LVPDAKQLFVSLAAAEYVMFTPLFCIIFWYRVYKKGKLAKVIFSNEEILRDEASHCLNGCENYKELTDKYTDEEVHEFIDRVVQIISEFADEVLQSVDLEELTPANVRQHIRYAADDLLTCLGHRKFYYVSSPFLWMDFANLIPKTNFYEGSVGEYARLNVQKSVSEALDLSQSRNLATPGNVYKLAKEIKF